MGDALFKALRKLRAFLKRDLCFDTPPAGGVWGDAAIALAGDATLIPQVTERWKIRICNACGDRFVVGMNRSHLTGEIT